LRREVYERLSQFAREANLTSLSDAVLFLLNNVGKQGDNTEITNMLKNIESKINELHATLSSMLTTISSKIDGITTTRSSKVTTESSRETYKRKPTIRDVIKSRKVQLLSELTLRNPDSFIEKAKREGVVVIEGTKDVAFVDPEYWEEFEKKMSEIPREPRDPVERKLIMFLSSNGIVFWENGWRYVP